MNSGSKVLKIAAMPGDGIGKEVMPEGLRVLDAASRRFGFELQVDHINWGSCDHYMRTGAMIVRETPRANTRTLADASSKAPIARSLSRNRCSRATAPTGS